jgi:hypothetical protein
VTISAGGISVSASNAQEAYDLWLKVKKALE